MRLKLGLGLIWLIILIAAGLLTLEAYFLIVHPDQDPSEYAVPRLFSLEIPQNLPQSRPLTVRKNNSTAQQIPLSTNPSSNSHNPIIHQYNTNSQPVTLQNNAQILINQTQSQAVAQTSYQLNAVLLCKNGDDSISGLHTDLEISFQVKDRTAGYFYTLVTENSSGKVVYGPFTSGDPINSASIDVLYHGQLSGLFTNSSDLDLQGSSGTLTIRLFKSSDPVINGSEIKETTVYKNCAN